MEYHQRLVEVALFVAISQEELRRGGPGSRSWTEDVLKELAVHAGDIWAYSAVDGKFSGWLGRGTHLDSDTVGPVNPVQRAEDAYAVALVSDPYDTDLHERLQRVCDTVIEVTACVVSEKAEIQLWPLSPQTIAEVTLEMISDNLYLSQGTTML